MDRHKHPMITPRVPAELLNRVRVATAVAGTNVSAVVNDLLRWYVGDTEDPPPRPVKRRS